MSLSYAQINDLLLMLIFLIVLKEAFKYKSVMAVLTCFMVFIVTLANIFQPSRDISLDSVFFTPLIGMVGIIMINAIKKGAI